MSKDALKHPENTKETSLLARIKELEEELQHANETVTLLHDQREDLYVRIEALEKPNRGPAQAVGVLSHIVLLMRKIGRPMRSREIVSELRAYNSFIFYGVSDPSKYTSVVLTGGKKSGRLKHFPVRGTRGGYYAIEEWVDKEGQLLEEMKEHLH